jgi:tetraacyldisaccharide 4'-kinase
MVHYLIHAAPKDLKVAVLTRGYGRKTKSLWHAQPGDGPRELGDEAADLRRKFPDIELVCSASRVEGMRYLEQEIRPDLVLLDDAFQHRSLVPHAHILLTTWNKPYHRDHLFPWGSLRDIRSAAQRAEVVVVTKSLYLPDRFEQQQWSAAMNLKAGQHLLFAQLSYNPIVSGPLGTLPLEDLLSQNPVLVTGIADPSPLVDYLKSLGWNGEHRSFSDHHSYSAADFQPLGGRCVLTTEKDSVKWQGLYQNWYAVGVAHTLDTSSSGWLKNMLLSLVGRTD